MPYPLRIAENCWNPLSLSSSRGILAARKESIPYFDFIVGDTGKHFSFFRVDTRPSPNLGCYWQAVQPGYRNAATIA
jgi:hypothetical protein